MADSERSVWSAVADALEHDWRAIARPEQLPPGGDWSTWMFLGGRGAGKTRAAAEWVRETAESGNVSRIALVAATTADVRDVMIGGDSGIMSICPNSNRPTYFPSLRRLEWPNGVVATTFSSEEPERLRGPQFGAAWCDELAAWRNINETWSNLQFGLRLGKKPRQVVTTTPKPVKLLRELIARDGKDVAVTKSTTYANRENLAEAFFSQIVRRFEGTRLGRQELNAEILDDIQGALWSRDLLEQTRKSKDEIPPLRRVVIAIDPAVSVSESSDSTGVIVAALGVDDHAYVLEDASAKFLPIDWARCAVSLYRNYAADRIVAEANQGGLMVEQTVRTVDKNVSFKAVHASRGKVTRAEPIAALFEQRRAHLVGIFPELEDEMCTFAAGSSGSPDRLDALVWALTELMIEGGSCDGFLHYMQLLATGVEPGRSGDDEIVRVLAPTGCSHVQVLSGRQLTVPPDRILELAESDARPLLGAGFVRMN